jgi:GT2 family glycosyltransferase
LLSILTQSVLPDYICIYNDGEPYDMMQDYDMSMILRLALRKGVTIEHKEGDKKHQTYNHNRATYEMPTDYIIRLDDDGFAENNLVETFVDALNNDGDSLYGCATKWAHKMIPYDPDNKNTFDAETLEKNFLSTTEFDKVFTEPVQVGFLHGHCFAFKKDDKLHQPDWSLEMTVCEDTAFCLRATQSGKKLFVIPTTTYWHLQPVQTMSQDNTKASEYLIPIHTGA